MDRRVVVLLALAVGGALLAAAAAGAFEPLYTTDGYHPGTSNGTGTPTDATSGHRYEQATVTVRDARTNATLGTVRVAVAETFQEKYTGLSKTEHLPEDRGMLFVYDEPSNHTYVMRGMDFGIDIVYVGADGRITSIHHAPEPPAGADGEDYRYPGYGQYVLEVNYNWTVRHDVEVGDRVIISGDEA